MPDRATTSTKAEFANPRELTSRIEQHNRTANKELLDLFQCRSKSPSLV